MSSMSRQNRQRPSDKGRRPALRHSGCAQMKRRGALWGLLVALASCVTVVATASAETLPDVSIALGGSYPIHSQFNDNGKTTSFIENTSGERISSSSGLSALLLMTELSSLGTYEVQLLAVKASAKSCNTSGDSSGVVLVSGTSHIVLLAGKTTLGLLFLQPKVTIACEGLNIKVEGSALASLQSTGTESTELTQVGGILKGVAGNKGKPELTKYINDEGTESTALLLSNFGTGFLESAQNVEEEITATTLEGKMFVISPR
jgi:hypothetical protein